MKAMTDLVPYAAFLGGGFQVDWTRFEDHWHLQIMWAKPYRDQFPQPVQDKGEG